MKKIGFDIDGTISTNDSQYKLYEEKFKGFNVQKDFDVYPLKESLLKKGYVNKDFDEFNFFYENREVAFATGDFYEDFKILYKYLKENNYEIYFITARNKKYEELTRKLFELNDIPFENVYHLGTYDKINTIKELELDMFFEDNVNNINQIIDEVDNVQVGFIEAPYNKTFNSQHERIHLFRTWKNVLKYFFIK